MIKYGSRVDLFVPIKSKIYVRLHEQVRADETIIGELPNSKKLKND
jgi:hypothetical protein